MPDNPEQSCCGPGDVYYADKFETAPNGDFYAIVTDTRPDIIIDTSGNVIATRPHIAPGTRVLIPPQKFKDPRKDPNPTEHGILWVRSTDLWAYCYVNPEGQN